MGTIRLPIHMPVRSEQLTNPPQVDKIKAVEADGGLLDRNWLARAHTAMDDY